MAAPYGFKCDTCGHEKLEDTTVNGWTCPECGKGKMYHDINVKGGRMDAYAWPGGYPLIYVDSIGDVYCNECAAKLRDEEGVRFSYDIYMEGASLHCDGCNKEIESAYGDPEQV